MSDELTQAELKRVLAYNADTGVFTWREKIARKIRVGCIAGSIRHDGYVLIQFNMKRYLAHRIAWLYVYGEFPPYQIDHIDGNPSNNVIANLRPATSQENNQNQIFPRKDSTSGFMGVYFHKTNGKFIARISTGVNRKHLGCFDTADEASASYIAAKRKFHKFCTI